MKNIDGEDCFFNKENNMLCLGTCNFNQDYNGSFVDEKKAIDIIKAYADMGGKIIDTAYNYKSIPIIKKAKWKGKVITKIWEKEDFIECLDGLGAKKIYACLVRGNDKELISYLHDFRADGIIEKVGQSIYYDNELNQRSNIFQVPYEEGWIRYLPTMLLHADVHFRSYYNLYLAMGNRRFPPKKIKELYDRKKLNHTISFVMGVSSIEQLKENMEMFK
jgi:hypothetical protein